MLKTKRMSKIQVIGPKKYLAEVIANLHDLGALHVIDHKKTDELDIGEPLDVSEKISEIIVNVRSLISQFNLKGTPKNKTFNLNEIETQITELTNKQAQTHDKIKEIDLETTKNNELLNQLELLNSLYLDIETYKPYNNITYFLGQIKERNDIKKHLNRITQDYKLQVSEYNGKTVIALFIQNKHSEKIEKILKDYSFSELQIDKVLDLEGPAIHHINKINTDLEKLYKEKEHLQHDLEKVAKKHKQFLLDVEHYLDKEAEKAEAPLRFASTEQVFFVTGFVPKDRFEKTKHALEQATKKKMDLQIKEIDHHEKVPIEFNHTKLVQPFQFFMELFSIPGYREIDPTIFLMLTFPFFFGLMLGDVGYGVVCFILFAILRFKFPKGKQLFNAMMWCAIITIMFGFVFGEYFGYEYISVETGNGFVESLNLPLHVEELVLHGTPTGEYVYQFPRLMNRLHAEINVLGNTLPLILVIGGLLGVLHVNIGLFLGFINELHHSLKLAILAKGAWWILQAGALLLALSAVNIISLPMWIGGIIIAISAVMLVFGEGIQGLVEIPGIFTNILSYFRLGAVGLASVGLAIVVNESLAGPFFEKGGWFILLGIIIFIAGHTINIALGVIGPFLHSIRLHYVEFFGKFYKGGGMKYIPFGQKEQ